MADGNGGITYSTKELLQRMDEKLDRITDRIEVKADAAIVDVLQQRIQTMEIHGSPALISLVKDYNELKERVTKLEAPNPERLIKEFRVAQEEIGALESWRNRIVGAMSVMAVVVGTNSIRSWLGM